MSLIPLIRAGGSHREAGQAVGAATADYIHRSVEGAEYDHELVLRYRGASVSCSRSKARPVSSRRF